MHIGENIRRHRDKVHLTQKQLAERAGLKHTRISEIENGKGNPTIATLIAIASALETSVDKLVRHVRTS